MKEKPILFSAPMVRAILAGTKTQTRRVVKYAITGPNQPHGIFDWHNAKGEWLAAHGGAFDFEKTNAALLCPYGQPGDRLWVRETWQGPLMDADLMETEYRSDPDRFHKPDYCVYAADGGDAPEFVTLDDELVKRWRPSIHMPRWASRILLEVTGVRVERLNDISEADAKAEGAMFHDGFGVGHSGWRHDYKDVHDNARSSYARLWQEINGPGSWEANPWVWVISFKRIDNA